MSEENKPAESASAESQNLENAKTSPKPRARRTTRTKKTADAAGADASSKAGSRKSKAESKTAPVSGTTPVPGTTPAPVSDTKPASVSDTKPSEPVESKAAPVSDITVKAAPVSDTTAGGSRLSGPPPARVEPPVREIPARIVTPVSEPAAGAPAVSVPQPPPVESRPSPVASQPAPVSDTARISVSDTNTPPPPQVSDTVPFKSVESQTAERPNDAAVQRPNDATPERINDQTNKRPNEDAAEPQSPREERLAKWGRFQRGRGRFRDRRNRFHNDQQQGQQDGQPQSENGGEGPQEERPQLPPLKLWELEGMSLEALNEKLEGFFTPEELAGTYRKHDVINDFIRAYMRRGGTVITNGVIEIMSDGFGFLRSEKSSYLACPEDVYVAPNYVRRFNLRTGDFVEGPIRDPRERPERGKEKFLALGRIETVNGRPPAEWRRIIPFENLTPIFPTRRIQLERISSGHEPTDISMRFVDLFAPIGFGQRGLIVAPPRTGKTVLLQKVANAITANYPDAYLIVLLIDERPEEVTDMERNTKAHVLSSTFDEAPERHAQVSEMAIEMAKRKVESGTDVVILLDSITRLARAYNTLAPHSGKILSGGVDANAMFKPKRFFGAARNIEGGGSLTIIATALIETGSRMDEVIFEEFKGTGNMELVLDRQLSDRRIFPAINVGLSGTRKEELIVSPPELNLARNLRKMLTDSPTPLDSMDNIIKHMKKFNSNLDLMMQKFNS